MQEALWVLAVLIVFLVYAVARIVPGDQLVIAGQYMMLRAAAVGVPLELVYFMLLAWALRANGDAPKGWYWRSFEHHHRLHAWQRRIILPAFYAGALAFLGIVLGIAVSVLGFIAVLGLRE